MSVQLQLFANNASTTLSIGIGSTDTQLTVTSGTAFPSPTGSQWFLVTLESSGVIEVIKISSRSGNVLTISGGVAGRAQEGTTANSFTVGTVVECRVTRDTLGGFLATSNYLPYISSTTLSAPTAMSSSAYVAGVDDGGAGVVACAVSTTAWTFPSYSTAYAGNATTGSQTTLNAASLPLSGTAGKYVIQFTSGLNTGQVRPITGYGSGFVSWATNVTNAVTTDGYTVYQSNYSIIQSVVNSASAEDNALIYSIVFGN